MPYTIRKGVLYHDGRAQIALGQSYYPSYHPQKVPVPPTGDRLGEMAKDLRAMREAGFNVVRMAALLHDCARTEELSTKGKRCHARLGAALAKTWLEEEGGFEPDFIKQVANAVRTHRYRSGKLPDTLEGEIVYDADKLDSLGAIGIGRAFLFAGREGARVHNSAREALHGPGRP